GCGGACLARAAQSQFLNFQDLSFQGVNVSNRQVSNRSDRWPRREVSFTTTGARSTTRDTLRRTWRVASLIISTNSGLSAISSTSRIVHSRKQPVCPPRLNAAFPERLEIETTMA